MKILHRKKLRDVSWAVLDKYNFPIQVVNGQDIPIIYRSVAYWYLPSGREGRKYTKQKTHVEIGALIRRTMYFYKIEPEIIWVHHRWDRDWGSDYEKLDLIVEIKWKPQENNV